MDLAKEEFGLSIGEGTAASAAKVKIEKTEQPSTVTPIDQSKVVNEAYPVGQQAKPEQPIAQSQTPVIEPKQSAPIPEQKQVENLASAANQAPAQKLFSSQTDTASKIEQSRPQPNLIASKPIENVSTEPKSAAVASASEVKQVTSRPPEQNQAQSTPRESYSAASLETAAPKTPISDSAKSDYSKFESPVSPPRYADTSTGAQANRNFTDQKDPTSRVLDATASKTNSSSEGAAHSGFQGQTRAEVQEASAPMTAKVVQRETVQAVSESSQKSNVAEPLRQDAARQEPKGVNQIAERSDNRVDAVKTETSRNAEVRVAESADVQTSKSSDVQTSKSMPAERSEHHPPTRPQEAAGGSGQKNFTENTPNQNRPDARPGVSDSGSRGVGGGGNSSFDGSAVRAPEPHSVGSTQPIKESHSGDSPSGGSTGKPLDDSIVHKPNKLDANQNVATDSGSRGVGGGSSSPAGNRLPDISDKTIQSDSSSTPSSKHGDQSVSVSADNIDRRPVRQPTNLDGEFIGPILDGDKKTAKPTDLVQPPKRDPIEISNQISRELDRLLTNKAMQPKILAVIEHLLDKKPLPADVPKDLLDVVKHTDPDRLKTLSVVIRGALAQQELLQTNPKATPIFDVALIADSSIVRARKGSDKADEESLEKKMEERFLANSDSDFTDAIAALKEMRRLFRELQQELPASQRSNDRITDELEQVGDASHDSDQAASQIAPTASSATYVPPHDESLEQIALRLLGDKNLAPLLIKVNPRLAVGAGNIVVAGSTISLPSVADISCYRNDSNA